MNTPVRPNALLAIAAAALLAGCASNPAPVVDRSLGNAMPAQAGNGTVAQAPASGTAEHANGEMTAQGYRVARGDTLYSIAFTHGVDFRALAARNDIPPPYTIHPGQMLRIDSTPAPASNPAVATSHVQQAQQRPPATHIARNPPANTAPVFGPLENNPPEATAEAAPKTTSAHELVSPSSAGLTTLPQVNLAQGSAPATAHAPQAPLQTPVASPPQPAANSAQLSPSESRPLPAAASGRTRSVDGIAWQWPADGAVISDFSADGGSGAGLDIAGKEGDPVRAAADGTVVYSGNGLIGYGELIIIKHSDNYLSAYGHNRRRLVQEGQHVRAGQQIAEMGSTGASREELHFEIRKNGKPVDPTGYLPGR